MKINHVNDSSQIGLGTTKLNGNAKPSGNTAGASVTSSEKLSISDLSTRLNDLEARLSQTGEFDAAKVESIKQAIREGRFKINPDVVADRLVESVKQLLGK
jgi:negative regulator of flagellin synthesis FlgM